VRTRLFWLSLVVAASAWAGCDKNKHASEPPELDPGEHLLLTPRGDPEALLGRTVTESPEGGLLISDERPPGCEVAVRRVPESWHRNYQQDVGRAAHVGTGDTPIGSLQAQYGKSLRIEAEIDNVEVLHADLRGCEGRVVSAVKVGTGKREIKAQEEAKADIKVKVKGVPVGAGGGKWRNVARGHEWSVPQAWAFSVRETADPGQIRVDLVMPSKLRDGEQFSVRVLTSKQVWVVAGFVREDGTAGILVPRTQHPRPVITSGSGLDLTLQARLPAPEKPSREKFVVYAFSEEGDFDMFKPPQGELGEAEAAAYFAELPKRLEAIPSRRWSTTAVHLLVEPIVAGSP
jgi:hypothetical protein